MGSSSVHTSRQSLMLGEQRIRELRQGLRS
jgi:hypothetical protein